MLTWVGLIAVRRVRKKISMGRDICLLALTDLFYYSRNKLISCSLQIPRRRECTRLGMGEMTCG